MSNLVLDVRKRTITLPRPDVWGAFRTELLVELACPMCGRWTGLSPDVIAGRHPFVCPVLGCSEWLKRDMTRIVDAAQESVDW